MEEQASVRRNSSKGSEVGIGLTYSLLTISPSLYPLPAIKCNVSIY